MKGSKYSSPNTLASLDLLNKQGRIIMNPDYQRNAVWVLSQKQLLMDSILCDLDIPKIYFRKIEDKYEVVDGQQRLRTVFDFIDDAFKMPRDADTIDDYPVADLKYSELASELQTRINNATLDIVHLVDYSDEDVEEMFLRLQNGTSLKPAEKRRAIQGSMRDVVRALSAHSVFELCEFGNRRFEYEDIVAKSLHLLLAGKITDIKPNSIKRTYEHHRTIDTANREVRILKKAMNFLNRAFSGTQSPSFRKYSILSLLYLVAEMLDVYDLSDHEKDFAKAYLDFQEKRIRNAQLPEERQDPTLSAFADAARADSIYALEYRNKLLKEVILNGIPTLALKDETRVFTPDQRFVIYKRDNGVCQECGKHCDDTDFHADHIVPHSRGGKTTIENGQVLCSGCNLAKGASIG